MLHLRKGGRAFGQLNKNHFRSVGSIAENVRSALIVPTTNNDRAAAASAAAASAAAAAAVAAVCLVNKRGGDGEFGEADERVAKTCLR